ncbi:hypothetical protein [Methanosarcina horonobensis]|nr:hypothetical protein [Methanosarcina horonobensis]
MPAGTGLEIKPDLPGRILAGDKIGSLTPGGDLSIGLVKSRLINLRPAEDETKEK